MNQEGLIKPRSAVSVRLGWRMEQATKINTYIYNEINTGPTGYICGSFVGSGTENHYHSSFKTILLTCMLWRLRRHRVIFFTAMSKQVEMENTKVFYLRDYLAI